MPEDFIQWWSEKVKAPAADASSGPVSSSFTTLQNRQPIPDHVDAEAQALEQSSREISPAVSVENLVQTPDRLTTTATDRDTPMTQQASASAMQNLGARPKTSNPLHPDYARFQASAFAQTQSQTMVAAAPVARDKSQRIRVAPEIVLQDIASVTGVDYYVNAANPKLQGGTGVNGAIRAAGGSELKKAMQAMYEATGRVRAGKAVITDGYDLGQGSKVIHVVAPNRKLSQYKSDPELAQRLLVESYRSVYKALLEDIKNNATQDDRAKKPQVVLFPTLGTASYGNEFEDSLAAFYDVHARYEQELQDRNVTVKLALLPDDQEKIRKTQEFFAQHYGGVAQVAPARVDERRTSSPLEEISEHEVTATETLRPLPMKFAQFFGGRVILRQENPLDLNSAIVVCPSNAKLKPGKQGSVSCELYEAAGERYRNTIDNAAREVELPTAKNPTTHVDADDQLKRQYKCSVIIYVVAMKGVPLVDVYKDMLEELAFHLPRFGLNKTATIPLLNTGNNKNKDENSTEESVKAFCEALKLVQDEGNFNIADCTLSIPAKNDKQFAQFEKCFTQEEAKITKNLRTGSLAFRALSKKLQEWMGEETAKIYQEMEYSGPLDRERAERCAAEKIKIIMSIGQRFFKLAENEKKHTLHFRDIGNLEFVTSLPDVFNDPYLAHIDTIDLTSLTTLRNYPKTLLQLPHIIDLRLHTLPSEQEQEQMSYSSLMSLSIATPVDQWHLQLQQAFPQLKAIKFSTASENHQLSSALTGCPYLVDIDLSGSAFPENSKFHLGNIDFPQETYRLYLENCDLRAIPADIGKRLPELGQLYLRNNRIGLENLRPEFVGGTKLREVDLRNNQHGFKPKAFCFKPKESDCTFTFDRGLRSLEETSEAWCSTEQIDIYNPQLEPLLRYQIDKITEEIASDPDKILPSGTFINQFYTIFHSNHAEFQEVQQWLPNDLRKKADHIIDAYFKHERVAAVERYITDMYFYDPQENAKYGLRHPFLLVDFESGLYMRPHVYSQHINPLAVSGENGQSIEDSFMHLLIGGNLSVNYDMAARDEMYGGNYEVVRQKSLMLATAVVRARHNMNGKAYEEFLKDVLDFRDPEVQSYKVKVGEKTFSLMEVFLEAPKQKDYSVKLTGLGEQAVLYKLLSKHWEQQGEDQWACTLKPDFVKKAQDAYKVPPSQEQAFLFFSTMFWLKLSSVRQFGTHTGSPEALRKMAVAAYNYYREIYRGRLPRFSTTQNDWFNKITNQEDAFDCADLLFEQMYIFVAKQNGMKAIIHQWMPKQWQQNPSATALLEL